MFFFYLFQVTNDMAILNMAVKQKRRVWARGGFRQLASHAGTSWLEMKFPLSSIQPLQCAESITNLINQDFSPVLGNHCMPFCGRQVYIPIPRKEPVHL